MIVTLDLIGAFHTRRGKFPNKLVGDFPSLETLRAIRTDTLSTSCCDGSSLSEGRNKV